MQRSYLSCVGTRSLTSNSLINHLGTALFQLNVQLCKALYELQKNHVFINLYTCSLQLLVEYNVRLLVHFGLLYVHVLACNLG